jgi:hypothetical protein
LTDNETIRRAKAAHPNTYIIKSKPLLDEDQLIDSIQKQLLVSVNIALPDFSEKNKLKSIGLFYKVREVDLAKQRNIHEESDPIDKEMLLRYEEIAFVESNNKNEKNTVLIRTDHGNRAFILRRTMKEMEEELPEHFTRIHDSYIINLYKVTARRLPHKLFIDDLPFNIGEKYKDITIEKLNLFLGS